MENDNKKDEFLYLIREAQHSTALLTGACGQYKSLNSGMLHWYDAFRLYIHGEHLESRASINSIILFPIITLTKSYAERVGNLPEVEREIAKAMGGTLSVMEIKNYLISLCNIQIFRLKQQDPTIKVDPISTLGVLP